MDDKCSKCKERKTGATPWLCFPCFKLITTEWVKFNNPKCFHEEEFKAKLKTFQNKVQRNNRKAYKRNNEHKG